MISLHFATDRPGTWQHSQTQAADLFLNIMLRVMSIQVAIAYHVCFIFCEIKMSYWFIYFSQSVPGRVAVVQEVTEEKGTWDSPSILHLHSTLSAYIWPTARHSVSVLALRAKKKKCCNHKKWAVKRRQSTTVHKPSHLISNRPN